MYPVLLPGRQLHPLFHETVDLGVVLGCWIGRYDHADIRRLWVLVAPLRNKGTVVKLARARRTWVASLAPFTYCKKAWRKAVLAVGCAPEWTPDQQEEPDSIASMKNR
jgi:hypothetical protein